MGLISAKIKLSNPRQPERRAIDINALVDTGEATLCVPEHIAIQLNLGESGRREITIADGKKILVPYVGPVKVGFENRNCYVGALVLGNEVLLGAISMEDMDLVLSPQKQGVPVNPENPNIP